MITPRKLLLGRIESSLERLPREGSQAGSFATELFSAYKNNACVDIEKAHVNGLGKCVTKVCFTRNAIGDGEVMTISYKEEVEADSPDVMLVIHEFAAPVKEVALADLGRVALLVGQAARHLESAQLQAV